MASTHGEIVISSTESFELRMLKKLSRGELKVKFKLKGKDREGYVHLLDFAKGGNYLKALVATADPDTGDSVSVEVKIFIDGRNGRDIDVDVLGICPKPIVKISAAKQ